MEDSELVDGQFVSLVPLKNVAHILYLVIVQVLLLIEDLILLLLDLRMKREYTLVLHYRRLSELVSR